tara:strand:+ start:88 stop:381 length:294 start_codon:yes stop_codon:yes gene_type:complete
MRKITEDAIRAFSNGTNFKRGNTQVKVLEGSNYRELCLHGNIIAVFNNFELYIRDGGWQSNTTKERLNGLPNVSIYQRNFEWFLNGEAWDGQLIQIT